MKYARVHFENGYYGCDEVDIWEYDDSVTEEDVEKDCNEHLDEYAENWSYVAFGWDNEETEEEFEEYLENCYFVFEILDEDELTDEDKKILGWEKGA